MQVDALKGVKLKYSRSFEMHYKSSLLGDSYFFCLYNEYSNEESVDRENDNEKYSWIKPLKLKKIQKERSQVESIRAILKVCNKLIIVRWLMLFLLLELMQQWGKCRQREQYWKVYFNKMLKLRDTNRCTERSPIEVLEKFWKCALKIIFLSVFLLFLSL